MLGASTGEEDRRYLLLTATPRTATPPTSALPQELLLLEEPGPPPLGPHSPRHREDRGEEGGEGSLEDRRGHGGRLLP